MFPAGPVTRKTSSRHTSQALLLRAVPYGEDDVIYTFLFETLGRVSTLARGARRPKKRPTIQLDSIHTLRIVADEKPGAELLILREARLERVRDRLVRNLDALENAGRALRWARQATPVHLAEPGVWAALTDLLDRLDDAREPKTPAALLAAMGVRLLSALGYGLELAACVRCGRVCEASRPGLLDPARGGLVCRACGGGPFLVAPEVRERVAAAALGTGAIDDADASMVLEWVEAALSAHTGAPEKTPRRALERANATPRWGERVSLSWSFARRRAYGGVHYPLPFHETAMTIVDHVLAIRPVRVKAPKGARVFEIHWADGVTGKISHEILRGYCPCAGCQGHSGAIKFVEGGDLELVKIDTVGNYALQLTWGDRHDTGLYSFRFLRSLSEFAATLEPKPDDDAVPKSSKPGKAGKGYPKLPRL